MLGALAGLLVAVLRTSAAAPSPGDAPTSTPDVDAVRDPFARIVPVDAPSPAPEDGTPPTNRVHTHAPLRDPFAAGTVPPPSAAISGDLKDPFARPAGASGPVSPHRDLRDPFEPRPGGATPGGCSTSDGVPLQRPKSLRHSPRRCAPSDAPLLDPFRTA